MNHIQAKLKDILNRTEPCMFSREGNNPFHYAPCKNCDSYNAVCDNYIPTRQTKPDTDVSVGTNERIKSLDRDKTAENLHNVLRPFYWYHSTITKSLQPKMRINIIRRINDRGAI